MTEAEWLAGEDAGRMLGSLPAAGSRKLRLVACACVRRIWGRVQEPFRPVVEAAERFADGEAAVADLEALYEEAYGLTGDNAGPDMDAVMCCCPEYAGGAAQAAALASRGAANEVADVAFRAVMDAARDDEDPVDAAVE